MVQLAARVHRYQEPERRPLRAGRAGTKGRALLADHAERGRAASRRSSQKLSEIHGNIWKVRCTQCGQVGTNRTVPIPILPRCPRCDGLLRPHIVWFGESLDPVDLERSSSAVRSCEVLLIIGTSGIVYPAASFASLAKEAGAFVAEVNLDPTPNTQIVDVAIRGRAKDIVPVLL